MKNQKSKIEKFNSFKINGINIMGGSMRAHAGTCKGTQCVDTDAGFDCEDWEDDEDSIEM